MYRTQQRPSKLGHHEPTQQLRLHLLALFHQQDIRETSESAERLHAEPNGKGVHRQLW